MYKIEFDQATRMMLSCSYIKIDEAPSDVQESCIYVDDPVYELAWVNELGHVVKAGRAPSGRHEFDVSEKAWIDRRGLAEAVQAGLAQVDSYAGQARLRYITSVPGQAETYAKKEEQARAWASAAFWGEAPSFIAAEAAALGVSAQSVAEEVISLADFWANVKGPQIEATRRKWKVSIESAATVLQVDQMVESAKAELDAL